MPTREDFLEKGYVYFGYISPEISSEDTFPQYIRDCANECVEKIQEVQNKSSITFGFMTDIHYSHTFNHNIRMSRAVNAYRDIANKVGCNRLILGGDYSNEGWLPYKKRGYRELRNHLAEFNYLPVNGNHEDNVIWDNCLQEPTAPHRIPKEDVYNLFFNHLPSLGAEFDKENPDLYYYFDDAANNVRYIFVDVCDFPKKYFNTLDMHLSMSQKQIDWLINKALDVEEGTDIVVVGHTAVFPDKYDEATDDSDDRIYYLNDILDAYKKGEKLNKKYGSGDFEINVDADFSKKKGNIIAYFAGHWHKDIIQHSKTGIPYIYVANFIMYNEKGHVLERRDGDKTELIFDMVTIDREKKTIYLHRVGAGEDRIVSY